MEQEVKRQRNNQVSNTKESISHKNEEKHMKKNWIPHICAYVSLVISIIILSLWICNAGGFTVVSLDSFVGIIVALLAIIVTSAIGWQIYNSYEMKNKVAELDALREKITKEINEIKKRSGHSLHLNFLILGNESYKNRQYSQAFRYYMCSLSLAMEANSLVNVMNLLNNLEDLNEENQEYSFDSISINCIRTYDDIIRESPEYQTIRFKYEEIYNKFQCKCKATEI